MSTTQDGAAVANEPADKPAEDVRQGLVWDPAQERAQERVQELAQELAEVKAEISAYPGPIAGCDAQFNHLLARRDALLAALRAERAPQRDQTALGM